jgi:hypothetical protein
MPAPVTYPSRLTARNDQAVLWPDHDVPAHQHDLNDLQGILGRRVQRIASALLAEGAVTAGGAATLDPGRGEVTLAAASVYALGMIHDVAAAVVGLPLAALTGTHQIGIVVVREIVTPEIDAHLKGEIPGSAVQGDEGAARLVVSARWSWSGAPDAVPTDSTTFVPVFTLKDGVLLVAIPAQPPSVISFSTLVIELLRLQNRNLNADVERYSAVITSQWFTGAST